MARTAYLEHDGPIAMAHRGFSTDGLENTMAAFEAAVAEAEPLFRDGGATSFALSRQVEDPAHYRLLIGWRTLEDHTVAFRESDAFLAWRALVTPHLAQPPAATHWSAV